MSTGRRRRVSASVRRLRPIRGALATSGNIASVAVAATFTVAAAADGAAAAAASTTVAAAAAAVTIATIATIAAAAASTVTIAIASTIVVGSSTMRAGGLHGCGLANDGGRP